MTVVSNVTCAFAKSTCGAPQEFPFVPFRYVKLLRLGTFGCLSWFGSSSHHGCMVCVRISRAETRIILLEVSNLANYTFERYLSGIRISAVKDELGEWCIKIR